ncbi:MAG: rod shape-determining protein [Verrucomicrobiales bacterium]|nr:rod shape-determining protein [Verrucomicrobiales bacterium]
MRTTFVAPLTPETARDPKAKAAPAPAPASAAPAASGDTATAPAPRAPKADAALVGLDLGTNKTCIKAAYIGSGELLASAVVPTLVGYTKEGIVENLLPGNAKVLYGEMAAKNRLYLRCVPPLVDGVVEDMSAAKDFLRHVRQLMKIPAGVELRTVVGVPANADRSAREKLLEALHGIFDKVCLIPEPFLAALGVRDEGKLGQSNYIDPVRNSLFVDIGAGTTDVCLVQGYFPSADDQVSSSFAGDRVDAVLADAIRKQYPNVDLSMVKVRELKEQFSYVGSSEGSASASVIVGGKMRRLELTEIVGNACSQLLQEVFELVKAAIGRASTDSVGELLQNIILTGGGSRVQNLGTELQRLLAEEGYEKPRVQTVGDNYREFVAQGALAAARQARESQWQRPGA